MTGPLANFDRLPSGARMSRRAYLRSSLALLLVRLAACGGEVSLEGGTALDATSPSPSVASEVPDFDAAIAVGAQDGAFALDAMREASVDASSETSTSKDSGPDVSDAGLSVDATDGAIAFDADLGDGACLPYYERCNGYVLERCDEQGHWFHPVRHMQCCVDERFVTHDSPAERWIEDTKTGRSWWAYTLDATSRSAASTLCPTMFAGGRLPTSAELLSIVLMTPMLNGERVCLPTTDRKFSSSAREYWTTDGCVSLATGLYTGTTCAPDAGYGNPPAVTCIRD